ncbi:MAG: helix-turn-helix domain-containing protein [Desulfovibrio sp.]|nr:helix-turn-helix domain-containing protein [Desulfovibrio sp.]
MQATSTEHLQRGFRAQDAARYLGVSKSHFWKLAQEGKLPKGKRLGSRCTLWFLEDLNDFLNKLKSDNMVAG